MRSWNLLTAVVFTIVVCTMCSVQAASLQVSIDGQSVDVPLRYEYYPDGTGYFEIGEYEGQDWEWVTPAGDSIRFTDGILDPDPALIFGSIAFDFGAPSVFSYTFTMALSPEFPNPSVVQDSFSGSVTNGSTAGGVTITALAPPVGIPVDGDGITEMQVYTLSDDNGATWKNVGLDLGTTETVGPLAPFAAGLTTPYNEGPIPTIAGGPWTDMRADINFSLSGGGDSFAFNGAKILVPEPSALVLAAMFLALLNWNRRNHAS